ncbi:MAG: MBL fold metallo-hydrolase [Candidatus Aenigmarchaeota archaeon]|nr:MBL fold metallo-hydrolase [Candidatus Aenigmarchaeota archaeon]
MLLGNIRVELFGHASVGIFGSKIIYIDPYILPASTEKADIILVTHEHYDHCAPDKVKQLQKPGTVIVANPGCAPKFSGDVRTLSPGGRLMIGGVELIGTHSYNTNKPYHLRGYVTGFIVRIDGKKIYHPGDTDYVPEMKQLAKEWIDVAFLPVGGTYTMTAEEAVEAARVIKPKIAVPIHYGSIVGSARDAERFKKLLVGSGIDVRIL